MRHLATACLFMLVLAPSAFAADPDKVTFTLEGCRLVETTSLPNANGDFLCTNDEYTTGNLGKNWNELDLVPFRLTADNNNGDQTYTVVIALDSRDGGVPGYDVISAPVLNEELSSGTCSVTTSDQMTLSPGAGGTDETIYRTLTITQSAGSTCVYDYYGRLALGSSQFPGASLHANLLNEDFGTAGIGARDVSIPVNEILPQELSKTMQATQGSAYTWDVSKNSSPVDTVLRNTCDPNAARSAPVTITVTWTRYAPSPTGDITVTTAITIHNPAHRAITANVTDTVYSGDTVVTPVTGNNPHAFPPTVVAPNSTTTLTHSLTVPAGTTDLHDVATATYTDEVTGIAIPGETRATASATVETDDSFNQTATITDDETLTGAGLDFSVDSVTGAPAGSGFTSPAGYQLGDRSDAVSWQSGVIDPGASTTTETGTITFQKTVYVDGPQDTTGVLADTATLIDSASNTHTANAETTITASRDCAKLTIRKVTVPAETNGGVFDFTPSASLSAAAFTLRHGEARDFNDLVPGSEHSVVESVENGYRLTDVSCDDTNSTGSVDDRRATARLAANEHVTCTFTNTKINANLVIVKTGTPDVVHDGDTITFTYDVTNPATNNGSLTNIVVTDDKCPNVQGPISKTGGNQDDSLDPGETWRYTCTTTADHADEVNGVITNVGTATGRDEQGNQVEDTDDETTRVIHPAIAIVKTGPASAQAGESVTYDIDVTNPGDTPFAAATVVVNDPRCDGSPALVSKNGDATPGTLDPGDRWSYRCTASTQAGDTSVHNVATVSGTDELGKTVSATDDATTVLVAPQGAVLGEAVKAGTARLSGPKACPSRTFRARVRGSSIASVSFILDGKRVKRLTRPNSKGTFALRINPNRMSRKMHRLVVRVTFSAASKTKSKTLRYAFKRCARQAVAPRFTG